MEGSRHNRGGCGLGGAGDSTSRSRYLESVSNSGGEDDSVFTSRKGVAMTDKQQEILDVVREHLSSRGIDAETVGMDASLSDDVGLDSLDTVELTLALEQRYGIEIPDSELEDLVTVGDAVHLIEKKVSVGA